MLLGFGQVFTRFKKLVLLIKNNDQKRFHQSQDDQTQHAIYHAARLPANEIRLSGKRTKAGKPLLY
jgi:hypothetical protein